MNNPNNKISQQDLQISVTGMIDDPNYQKMKALIEDMEIQQKRQNINQFKKNSQSCRNINFYDKNFKADYDITKNLMKKSNDKQFIESLLPKIKEQKQLQKQQRPAFITVNNQQTYFSVKDFAEKQYKQINYSELEKKYQLNQFQKFSKIQYEKLFQETDNRQFCYLDFKDSINQKNFRIVIELYADVAPIACENFLTICEGYRDKINKKYYIYKGQKIQRFRKNFFLQGGFFQDFKSIYGGYFQDESYKIKHNVPGIIGCANQGKPHTNSTSFYITMEEMEGLDKKGVAFGRVVEGLKEIQNLNKTLSDIKFDLQIIQCGKFYHDTHIQRPLQQFTQNEDIQEIVSLKSLNSDGIGTTSKSIKIECDNTIQKEDLNAKFLKQIKSKSEISQNILIQNDAIQNQSSSILDDDSKDKNDQKTSFPRLASDSNFLEVQKSNNMNASSQSNKSTSMRNPFYKKQRSSIMSSSSYSRKSSLSPLKKGKNNMKNLERRLSHESLITEIQELEQEELQMKQKRKELFCFTNYQSLNEKKSHLQHLEHYSEKFTLGDDFVNLMKSVEQCAKSVQKLLKKAYKFQDMDELIEQISEKIEENLIESESLSLIYNIKKASSTKVPQSQSGRFIIAYNPIDVQSLSDINQCGFTFIIFKKTTSAYRPATMNDFSQLGGKIDCAGYCLFGPNTQLVYHAGFRVNVYNYEKKSDQFYLTFNNIKAPKRKGIITLDTSKIQSYSRNLQLFYKRKSELMNEQQDTYYHRYTKSVAYDFHRTLLHGGILLIPKNECQEFLGGINFLEAQIFSYLIDKAWEISSTGEGGSILFKKCQDLQEKSALFLGCTSEIQELENIFLNIKRQGSIIKMVKNRSFIKI